MPHTVFELRNRPKIVSNLRFCKCLSIGTNSGSSDDSFRLAAHKNSRFDDVSKRSISRSRVISVAQPHGSASNSQSRLMVPLRRKNFCAEDSWKPKQSRPHCPCPKPMSSNACSLSSLLEEEWFLLTVFEHLVEYGFRECRLVCWRWYEVSQQFPVELGQVDGKQLRQIIKVFPKATSITMATREKEISDLDFFRCLTQLPALKLLRLRQKTLSHIPLGQPYFESIPQLTELTLKLSGSIGTASMLASIDHLTGLTKLQLTSGSLYLAPCTFKTLKGIRELKTDFDFFADGHGTCFFPALTNLTRLDLVSERKVNLRQRNRVIHTHVRFLTVVISP